MAYKLTDPPIAGVFPIASTDSGVSTVGGTTIPTPPAMPGTIIRAVDPTYGEGEFILLKGVSGTAVGSCVVYDSTSYATTLAPAGSNLPRAVAFAMAATNTTTLWGWYQISGQVVAKKTSGLALASLAAVGVKTAGLIAASGSGKEIEGALTVAKSTTATTVKLMVDRPHMQGRVS
jgi:hypothetical protein